MDAWYLDPKEGDHGRDQILSIEEVLAFAIGLEGIPNLLNHIGSNLPSKGSTGNGIPTIATAATTPPSIHIRGEIEFLH